MRERVRREDLEDAAHLTTPEQSTGRQYLVAQKKLMEFIRARPMDVARLMGTEVSRQLVAPQEFAAAVSLAELPVAGQTARSMATLLLGGLACFGAFSLSDRRVASFVIVVYLLSRHGFAVVPRRRATRFPGGHGCHSAHGDWRRVAQLPLEAGTSLTRLADGPTAIQQSSQ